MARYIHSCHKIVVSHACDGSSVEVTQAVVPEVERCRGGGEMCSQSVGGWQGSVIGVCVENGELGSNWAFNL